MLQFLLLALLASFLEVVRADGVSKGGAVAITVIVVIAFACIVSGAFYYWLENVYDLPQPNKNGDGYEAAASNEVKDDDFLTVAAPPAADENEKETA